MLSIFFQQTHAVDFDQYTVIKCHKVRITKAYDKDKKSTISYCGENGESYENRSGEYFIKNNKQLPIIHGTYANKKPGKTTTLNYAGKNLLKSITTRNIKKDVIKKYSFSYNKNKSITQATVNKAGRIIDYHYTYKNPSSNEIKNITITIGNLTVVLEVTNQLAGEYKIIKTNGSLTEAKKYALSDIELKNAFTLQAWKEELEESEKNPDDYYTKDEKVDGKNKVIKQ